MKKLVIIILFILWCIGSWYWYTCKIKGFCYNKPSPSIEKTKETSTIDLAKKDLNPLVFNWSDSKAITNHKFNDLKSSISDGLEEGKMLEIIGQYSSNETNSTSFENLGIARASEVKSLLLGSIPEDKINISSELNDSSSISEEGSFEAISFNWVIRNDVVKEVNDEALIYFPSDATNSELDPRIDQYLTSLSQEIIKSTGKLSITGHTDDSGDADYNMKLALERAKYVKTILVNKGVDIDNIIIRSKGETEPIAPNDTEEGKAKNRRTVLKKITN